MIILKENKTIAEGTWSDLPAGQEFILAKRYSDRIDTLRKELYGVFGDGQCFDDLGNAKTRIWEIAATSFVENTAKVLYPKGQKLNRQDSLNIAIQVLGKTHKVFGTKILNKDNILSIASRCNGWTR